jgi:hypothetical protein
MNAIRSRLLLVLAALLVVVGLPLLGKWARRHQPPRCELTGLRIESPYQVRVVDQAGRSHRFCCVRCARRWLARQADRPQAVYVTDEGSGAEIDARSAYFVSAVVTNRITRNRVHAFRDRAEAEKYARAPGARALTGDDRPFEDDTGPPAGTPSPDSPGAISP